MQPRRARAASKRPSVVRLDRSSGGRELTANELDAWVANFPIEATKTGWPSDKERCSQ
jgi:hypothetical protein